MHVLSPYWVAQLEERDGRAGGDALDAAEEAAREAKEERAAFNTFMANAEGEASVKAAAAAAGALSTAAEILEAEAEAGCLDEVAREDVGVTPRDEAVGREGVVTDLEGLD